LLLGLYYTMPSLVKTVTSSNTDDKTLSHALKKAWVSLGGANGTHSAEAVWDLIGESKLIPADSAELLAQMCDLLDAELADAAATAMGVKSKIVIQCGARVKENAPTMLYSLALSIPLTGEIEGLKLTSLLRSNFNAEKIDYMFPDDVEPIESEKVTKIANKFGEGLIIHLQRYRYDFTLGGNAKIYDRVEFPEHLSGSDFSAFAESDCAKVIAGCSFDLVAVLTHNDDTGYGLLLRAGAADGKGPWFKCCDSSSDAPTETSIESAFGGDTEQQAGYMLFYKVSGGSDDSLIRKISRMALKSSTAKVESAEPAKPSPEEKSGGGGCCTIH